MRFKRACLTKYTTEMDKIILLSDSKVKIDAINLAFPGKLLM